MATITVPYDGSTTHGTHACREERTGEDDAIVEVLVGVDVGLVDGIDDELREGLHDVAVWRRNRPHALDVLHQALHTYARWNHWRIQDSWGWGAAGGWQSQEGLPQRALASEVLSACPRAIHQKNGWPNGSPVGFILDSDVVA